jgi:putative FmdB family regulatory protein
MPLYEYKCQKCNRKYEQLYSVRDAPRIDECACGGKAYRMVSLIARTPNRWGDTNGYYDPGLGSYVANSQERDKKMKELGVVPLADYGTHYIDDRLDKEDQQMIQQEKDSQEVKRLEGEGVSRGEAFAQVYSTERMAADGLLPNDIKG